MGSLWSAEKRGKVSPLLVDRRIPAVESRIHFAVIQLFMAFYFPQ